MDVAVPKAQGTAEEKSKTQMSSRFAWLVFGPGSKSSEDADFTVLSVILSFTIVLILYWPSLEAGEVIGSSAHCSGLSAVISLTAKVVNPEGREGRRSRHLAFIILI